MMKICLHYLFVYLWKLSLFFSYYTLFIYKCIFSPWKQQLEMIQEEENLKENHTTPMIPNIRYIQNNQITEENSSLSVNSIFQKGKWR